ncbi:MAG: aminotransferase class V-fold PLP-dependent enzyme [Actinomycetota bacterium]|nr:aminotransferase class V-fold PLP-dependent enzyme [Actinomycetota bacterium]
MDDPLGLDPQAMRQLGYATVDFLVDRLGDPEAASVTRGATPAEMAGRVDAAQPGAGTDFQAILDDLGRNVLPFASRCDHPRYFAFVPGSGTWPAALGDLIAGALNIYAGSWQESAGPSQVELVVLDWFKSWIGYPPGAAGVLVTGGSAANMTALACAREALLGAMSERVVAYVSDQAHSSIVRAARVLGFRPDQVRVLPTDDDYRMRPEALAAAMVADRRAGRRPLFVAASAGSTNTGAVDPLAALADVCRDNSVWLHVDAAYGGFAALTERGRGWLAGLERADSVTLDPHKWLYQPFECGSLLVRNGELLRRAFEITPDYLKDAKAAAGEVNFSDLSVQLTRMSRALKLWVSLRYFGVDAFRATIDRCLDLVGQAQQRIEASSALELLRPASLGILCFRRRFPDTDDEEEIAARNAALVAAFAASGEGLVSSTRLRGRYAIRLCVLNHGSGADDVERVLRWFEQATPEPVAPRRADRAVVDHERHTDVDRTWLGYPPVAASTLRALPLFAELPDGDLERIGRAAEVRAASAGETVVRRWDAARDFYVIVEGTVAVHVDDRHVRDLAAGDFFGELAALDWGASFGYARLATVVATTDVQLVMLPGATLNELVHEFPGIEADIRRAVAERLPQS